MNINQNERIKLRIIEMLVCVCYLLEMVTLYLANTETLILIPALISAVAVSLSLYGIEQKLIMIGIKDKKMIAKAKILNCFKSLCLVFAIMTCCIITKFGITPSLILLLMFFVFTKLEKDYLYKILVKTILEDSIDELIKKIEREVKNNGDKEN